MKPQSENRLGQAPSRHLQLQLFTEVCCQSRQASAYAAGAPVLPSVMECRTKSQARIDITESELRQGPLEKMFLQLQRGRRRGGEIRNKLLQDLLRISGRGLFEKPIVERQQSWRRITAALQFLIEGREGSHPVLARGLLGALLAELVVACAEILILLAERGMIGSIAICTAVPYSINGGLRGIEPPQFRLDHLRNHGAHGIRPGHGIGPDQRRVAIRVARQQRRKGLRLVNGQGCVEQPHIRRGQRVENRRHLQCQRPQLGRGKQE